MLTLNEEHSFSPGTRWIWAPDETTAGDNWWMFRRTLTLPADCREAQLRITAAFHYLLYINGTLVTRGPARSYDFRKAYDTVDIQPYLRPGAENVVAILAPTHKTASRRGVLAELRWRNAASEDCHMVTDQQWRVRRHPAFPQEVAGCAPGIELLLWIEERFDAREEPLGWTVPGFDDSGWDAAVELGPALKPPFLALEPSGIGLLSDDPVLPQAVTAIELARLRSGYRFRFVAPAANINDIKVYATEVACATPATVRVHNGTGVSLDGLAVAGDTLNLTPGRHLLCICQRGYYAPEMEVLLETEAELAFSAAGLLAGGEASWAWRAFPAAAVNYPWHETPATIPDPPELVELLKAPCADALTAAARAAFVPALPRSTSVALDVRTQSFHRVRGGHTDPMLEKAQPRLPSDDSLAVPLRTPQNLLHAHADPASLLPTPGYDAHFIVDFGIETIGYLEFTVDAPAGTVIDMQAFEYIGPGGIAWMTHNGFRYQCREGLQTFTSHHRRGFRYVSVTVRGFDRPVQWYGLRCRRAACPVQRAGSFECSDWQLNQAWRMSVETAALCMLDTYVDCPGHEQSFWVGDAPITSLANLLNFGAYDLDQRSTRLVGLSLTPEWVAEYCPNDERYTSGRYLPIAAFPNYPPEGGLPMWPLLWLIQCWNHWLYGGDRDDLKENYGYMADMLRRCRLLTNERGLLDIPGAWNLLDWGNNDLSPYGEVTANNMHVVLGLRLAARMARDLGKADEAAALEAEADERQAAINRLCWDDERQGYVDTVRDEWAYRRYLEFAATKGWTPWTWEQFQACRRVSEQTNIAALYCGCVPPERRAAVLRIARRVELGRFVGGSPAGRTVGAPSEKEAPDGIVALGTLYFLFFALDVLFEAGEGRAAIEVMHREWGLMAALGFRTCPESHGWARSAAHGWSAAPAAYLPMRVLGIRPIEPGYRTFVVAPCPGDLAWARGSVATPHGPIHVSWQRNDKGELAIECLAPAECRRELAQTKGGANA
jgi:hypothetical protein